MLDLRPVLYVIGVLLAGLAGLMLLPALVDFAHDNPDWQTFLVSAAVTLFVAGGVLLANRSTVTGQLSVRQAFLLTTLSWVIAAAFAALPLVFSGQKISYAAAYFEAMSGLTTTGSTVLSGLDGMPPGLLLWRSMLQGFGGVGIIVIAVAVFPALQVGGMQLFRTESSDRSEKIVPRAAQLATNIGGTFVGLTLACAIAYWLAGMSFFDAVCHALTTIATGGFANYDASFGRFDSAAIEWIGVLFMLLGGGSFTLYILALHGRRESLWRDSQMQWYVGLNVVAALVVGLWHYASNEVGLHQALRHAFFNVISITTTTGFAASDYSAWGPFAVAIFFALAFVGGCTGSTTGGIKIFRFQILFGTMRRQFFGLISPHGVKTPTFNRKPVPPDVPLAVMSFFFLYGLSTIAVAVALALIGLDFTTAISGAASAIGNVGPGLGEIIGPAGNFATLPAPALWLLSFAMLLGRLELFTVLMIFTPRFWRD
jgi:trk system potassium uptake protein TrkH